MNNHEESKFEVGRTYWTRSAGDSNCVWHFRVTKRTKCFVTGEHSMDGVKRFKVFNRDGVEYFQEGSYSMAPCYAANRPVVGPMQEG